MQEAERQGHSLAGGGGRQQSGGWQRAECRKTASTGGLWLISGHGVDSETSVGKIMA